MKFLACQPYHEGRIFEVINLDKIVEIKITEGQIGIVNSKFVTKLVVITDSVGGYGYTNDQYTREGVIVHPEEHVVYMWNWSDDLEKNERERKIGEMIHKRLIAALIDTHPGALIIPTFTPKIGELANLPGVVFLYDNRYEGD